MTGTRSWPERLRSCPRSRRWLHDLQEHPPAGYTVAAAGNGVDAVRARTRDMGLDFAVFQNTVGGKPTA